MAIWYVDLEGSAGLGNGTSFANRSSALATIVTGAANGDDVRVKASDDPTSIGTCTWTENGSVTIPSGLVKEIYSDGAWTGATNVTATASTVTTLRKEGISSASMAIAAGFVTGKIAYFPLGSTQDFSAYSKISFWFRSSLASIAASTANYRLALCSDTNGDVVVNNLSFPSMQLAANYMNAINLDNGSSLGSSIQSVALYRDTTDPGTVTLIIDNMFATNDIALNTVISNNTTAEWFSIRSILGTNLIIDQGNLTINVPSKGYPKETITTETFISQGFLIAPVATAATVHFTLSKNATQASPITITGGWDRTSMSTQTSITHVNSRNFLGRFFNITGTWLVIEKFMFSHGDSFIVVSGDNNVIRNCSASAIYTYGIQNSGVRTNILLENNYLTNCSDGGMNIPGRRIRINNCEFYCNYSYGIFVTDSFFSILSGCIVKNNTTYGFYNVTSGATQFINCSAINSGFGFSLLRSFNTIMQTCIANSNTIGLATSDSVLDCFNFSTSANSSASVSDEGTVGVNAYFYNWTRSEATPVAGLLDYNNGLYYSINDSNTIDNHIIYTDGGRISSVYFLSY
jgi:parallel beta-helix repeat protein